MVALIPSPHWNRCPTEQQIQNPVSHFALSLAWSRVVCRKAKGVRSFFLHILQLRLLRVISAKFYTLKLVPTTTPEPVGIVTSFAPAPPTTLMCPPSAGTVTGVAEDVTATTFPPVAVVVNLPFVVA